MRAEALLPCVLAACGGASGSWSTVTPDQFSPPQSRQRDRAVTARDTLARELLGKLTQTLQADGPADAIGVCRELAPMLAETVSRQMSLRIGRTSDRLRNPENSAPAWAWESLQRRPESPTFLAGPGGELGVLLPIRVQMPQCLGCHGAVESIDPAVREQLHRLYPDDRAIGYRQDDLRGWFWVEVPRQ